MVTWLWWGATAPAAPVDPVLAVDAQREVFVPCGLSSPTEGKSSVGVDLTIAPDGSLTVHAPAGEGLTERQRCVAEKLAALPWSAPTDGVPARTRFSLLFAEPGVAPSVASDLILGALDRSVIDGVIRADLQGIRRCYDRALRADPILTGHLVVKFTIAKDGSVVAAAAKKSTLYDPDTEACVVERFLGLHFPEPAGDGIVIVSYSFLFSPDAEPIPSTVAGAVGACAATVEYAEREPREPLVFEVTYEKRRAVGVRIGTERYEHLLDCITAAVDDLHLPKGSEVTRVIYSTSPGP